MKPTDQTQTEQSEAHQESETAPRAVEHHVSPDTLADILADVAKGINVTQAAEARGVSNIAVFSEKRRNPVVAEAYALAREAGAAAFEAEIRQIVSDVGAGLLRPEQARVMLDGLKILMSRYDPKGTADGGGGTVLVQINAHDVEFG